MNKMILVFLVLSMAFAGAETGTTDSIQPSGGLNVTPQITIELPSKETQKEMIYSIKVTEENHVIIATGMKVQEYNAIPTVTEKEAENESTYIPSTAGSVAGTTKKQPSSQKINELTVTENEDSTTIEFILMNEKENMVKIEKTQEKIVLESNGVKAETKEKIEVQSNGILIEKNGTKKELKLLPDKAKEKLSGLIDEVKEIELLALEKETVYKTTGTKNGKLLALIPVKMQVSAEINAETGTIKETKKPWWSFLVS